MDAETTGVAKRLAAHPRFRVWREGLRLTHGANPGESWRIFDTETPGVVSDEGTAYLAEDLPGALGLAWPDLDDAATVGVLTAELRNLGRTVIFFVDGSADVEDAQTGEVWCYAQHHTGIARALLALWGTP